MNHPLVKRLVLIGGVLGAIAAIVGIADFALQLKEREAKNFSPDEAVLIDHTLGRMVDTGVVRDFDPNMGLDYYVDRNMITYSAPKIDVEVVSQVEGEQIKVAPYLVIEVTNIEPIPEEADLLSVAASEVAPRSSPDWFYAVFTPQREGPFAAMRNSDYGPDSEFRPLDYATLKPHERKTFTLTTGILFKTQSAPDAQTYLVHAGTGISGYFYRFRVGVAYSYKGEQHIKWIDKEFVTGHLSDATQEYKFTWRPNSGYTLVGQQERESAPSRSTPAMIRDLISQHVAAQEAKLRSNSIPPPSEWQSDRGES